MSDQTTSSNQQTIVIALVVIAVLLAAIMGVLIYQQGKAVPAPTVSSTPAATDPAAAGGTSGQPAAGQPAAAAFDPKAATKVPKGTEPEAFVKKYYEACDKGDFKTAFDLLPAAKKTGNSPDALKQQLEGYGITGFKVVSAKVEGDKATVIADQTTKSYGTFENTWTFVKKDGAWLVEGKSVTGMK